MESFHVKLLKRYLGNVTIGIASNSIDPSGSNYLQCGWYLFASTGNLHSQSGSDQTYCDPIQENSIVGVKRNRDDGTISFSVDGVDKGVAFQNVPKDVDLCVVYIGSGSVQIVH